eukprot:gene11829-15830_t
MNNSLTDNLTFEICKLVTYLIVSIIDNEEEWQNIGIPFIEMLLVAQFGGNYNDSRDEGRKLSEMLVTLKDMFVICKNNNSDIHMRNLCMIDTIDDNSPQLLLGGDDYSMIYHADQFINSIVERFIELVNVDLEDTLTHFIDKLMAHILSLSQNQNSSNDNSLESPFNSSIQLAYNAKIRTICKRIFDLLNISSQQFSQVEDYHWKMSQIGNEDQESISNNINNINISSNEHIFSIPFNSQASTIPTQSLVQSFRLWKVAFIAASSGVVMTIAASLAAPLIIETFLPLLIASNSITALSTALISLTSYTGFHSATALIGSVGATYGASYAGYKMLKRTEPLKEFALEPLHMPLMGQSSGMTSSSDLNCTMIINSKHDSFDSGLPIFILISGHKDKTIDVRNIWGADGMQHNIKNKILRASSSSPSIEENINISNDNNNQNHVNEKGNMDPILIGDGVDIIELNEVNQENSSSDWEEVTVDFQGWWREMVPHGDEYILLWDPSILDNLNESFRKILTDKIHSMVIDELLKFTPVHALQHATSLPMMILNKIKEIDDPWIVAMERSRQAGILLARVLLAEYATYNTFDNNNNNDNNNNMKNNIKFDGKYNNNLQNYCGRPITLIGYGMGARVIFHCLETLANEGGNNGKYIIENVVMIGAPVGTTSIESPVGITIESWRKARTVVSNRFINCFATNDWILAILYRSKSYDISIAGISPVHLYQTTTVTATSTTGTASVGQDQEVNNDNNSSKKRNNDHYSSSSSCKIIEKISAKVQLMDSKNQQHQMKDIENVDVTHFIRSHSDYPNVLPQIIKLLNL